MKGWIVPVTIASATAVVAALWQLNTELAGVASALTAIVGRLGDVRADVVELRETVGEIQRFLRVIGGPIQ